MNGNEERRKSLAEIQENEKLIYSIAVFSTNYDIIILILHYMNKHKIYKILKGKNKVVLLSICDVREDS